MSPRGAYPALAELATQTIDLHAPPRSVLAKCRWIGIGIELVVSVTFPPTDVYRIIRERCQHRGRRAEVIEFGESPLALPSPILLEVNVPIRVICPSCGRMSIRPERAIGRTIMCSACSHSHVLTEDMTEPGEPISPEDEPRPQADQSPRLQRRTEPAAPAKRSIKSTPVVPPPDSPVGLTLSARALVGGAVGVALLTILSAGVAVTMLPGPAKVAEVAVVSDAHPKSQETPAAATPKPAAADTGATDAQPDATAANPPATTAAADTGATNPPGTPADDASGTVAMPDPADTNPPAAAAVATASGTSSPTATAPAVNAGDTAAQPDPAAANPPATTAVADAGATNPPAPAPAADDTNGASAQPDPAGAPAPSVDKGGAAAQPGAKSPASASADTGPGGSNPPAVTADPGGTNPPATGGANAPADPGGTNAPVDPGGTNPPATTAADTSGTVAQPDPAGANPPATAADAGGTASQPDPGGTNPPAPGVPPSPPARPRSPTPRERAAPVRPALERRVLERPPAAQRAPV